ncbi:NUDIX hydrolase [Nocardioides sp. GXZ039]|uniref:NUDIX hydrolase n=1 Tax=Nocardioides sp. GXZ039 TaxID=3136018 RepID=UPI0030F3AD47
MSTDPESPGTLPTLTDGVVTLRPWRESDVEPTWEGHDEQVRYWFGEADRPSLDRWREVVRGWRDGPDDGRFSFVIDVDGTPVGTVELRSVGEHTGELSYWLYAGQRGHGWAARAVRSITDWALTAVDQGGRGLSRVQARIEPENASSLRVANRSGLRREGIERVVAGTGDRPEAEEYVVLARLASDPPLSEPGAFRALLNSFLPRKRAIAQMLIRDSPESEARVLLCQLTYKQDWDLPGGVVEVGESPRVAVSREVAEELALTIDAGPLLLTDWLPPWGGWDDALCLVFDGGVHPASITDRIVHEAREIRTARFCTLEEAVDRCTDFTARRVEAALGAAVSGVPAFTESGRPVS